jgi:hypothetical protein
VSTRGLSAEVLKKSHPLSDPVDGWYFRIVESSSGAYEAEGFDAQGRRAAYRRALTKVAFWLKLHRLDRQRLGGGPLPSSCPTAPGFVRSS